MKFITRSFFALLFVLALAGASRAQTPKVAVRLDANKNCVKINLKNLTAAPIAVTYVELWIYDGKTCKRICATRKVIQQKFKACDTMDLELCCDHLPDASQYIYYVRVHHSGGMNEGWAFAP
jgi:hypothetical protein